MKKKVLYGIGGGIVFLILLIFIGFSSLYGKMNYQKSTEKSISDEEKNQYIKEEENQNLIDSDSKEISEADDKLKINIEDAEELDFNDGVFNILLIGQDGRETVSGARSDCMILCSINEETNQVILTSFMRDCYVAIEGHENNRLNASYAFGGVGLLKKTIENNFKIPIDRYVEVDFFSFMDIVDAIGGIDIELSDEEIKVLNDYLGEVNTILGEEGSDRIDGKAGIYHLNGKQTLAYSRNRYTGNSDYSRTERQRKILMAIKEEIKDCNPLQLLEIYNSVGKYITTDITAGEFLTMFINAPAYMKTDIISNRVPYDNTFKELTIRKMAVLSLDFEENINLLKKDIYGDEQKSEKNINKGNGGL